MRYSLGLCLSGGGARGIAHIGVLQALEEAGIVPDVLAGASAGAIVATLYAGGYPPAEILKVFKDSSLLKLFKVALPTAGLTDNGYIIEMLDKLLDRDDFDCLQKPLFLSVTNLNQGCSEIRHSGSLFEVVAASAAIPLLFKARQIDGNAYVDGGVLNNLPVEPLISCCDRIIGVNVTPIRPLAEVSNMLSVGYRTFDLVMWSSVKPRLAACDVIIEPDASGFGLFELWKADEIYQLGYDTTRAQLAELQTLMQGRGRSAAFRSRRQLAPEGLQLGFWARLWARLRRWWQRLWQRIHA